MSAGELKTFVERIERLNEEIKGRNDDKRDLYAEAKNSGFDPKALKIVIGRRAKGGGEVAELDALVETYETALGTGNAIIETARAPARTTLKMNNSEKVRSSHEAAKNEMARKALRAAIDVVQTDDYPDMPDHLRRTRVPA